ncbi:hypothetical protein K7432_014541 [Basidiobolus ranarum]|uniref:Rap-GAP domain-containing protein n=1 Tax=Basidiobolus ranarum TaxID=34480 RepID=A0ABR2VPE0_9FUNG
MAYVAAGSIPPGDKIRILEKDGIENGVAVGVGIDAAYASAKFMFELFKKHYLVKLFPQCARRLELINIPREQAFVFPTCPPSAVLKLISFLVEHCVDELKGNPKTTTSPACPILKTIILGSSDNREFIHDIIANALSLPIHDIQNLESARGAAYVLAVWMLSGENERPSFLRRGKKTNSEILSVPNASENGSFAQANSYLRQYFGMLISVLETGFECYDSNSKQEILIREVLSILRAVSQNGTIQLEDETWESLLVLLVNSFIVFATKSREVPHSYVPDELVDYFLETLFFIWGRSMTRNERLWNKLNVEILKTPRWIQTVAQWRSIMNQLVRILGEVYYESNCGHTRQSRRGRQQRPMSVGVSVRKPSRPTSSVVDSNERDEATLTVHSYISALSSDTRKGKNDGEGAIKRSSSHVKLFNSELNNSGSVRNHSNESSFGPFKLKDQEIENSSPINRRLTMEFANIEDSGFTHLFTLHWQKEVIVSMWKSFLHLLGNPNQISDPVAHTNAIRCLVEMWDMLAQIRSEQSFDAPCKPNLFEFAPWIFQASEMSSVSREGYLLSFGCVCRMLCRPQEDKIEEMYYAHFYQVLLRGLSIKDNELQHALFVHCRKIFGLSLPGCPAIIPAFLSSIKQTLHSSARYMSHYVNEPMCQNAVTILLSVICYPNHFPTLRIPNISLKNISFVDAKPFEHITANELKSELERTLFSCISETKKLYRLSTKTAQTHSMLMNGVCVLAFDELISNPNPSAALIQTCIRSILDHLYCHVYSVVIGVIDCLYTFSGYTEQLRNIDQRIVYDIIGNLIGAIDEYIEVVDNETISETGFVVARLFYCLLEWIMYSPSEFITHSGLRQMIFVTLEKAIQLELVEKSDFDLSTHRIKGYRNFGEISYSYSAIPASIETMFERNEINTAKEKAPLNIVQESGEIVLAHLLNYFGNQTQDSSLTLGTLSEAVEASETPLSNEDNVTHFIYNNNTLLTIVEPPNSDEEIKIFARNMTGKYSWDPRVVYGAPLPDLLQNSVDPEEIQNTSNDPAEHFLEDESKSLYRTFEDDPKPTLEEPKDYPLPPSPQEFDGPEAKSPVPESQISSPELSSIISGELEHPVPFLKESLNSMINNPPAATTRPERASTLQRQKTLLLSQLGMLNQNATGEESFIHLNQTSSLVRDIRGLDKKPGRETMKIGVLYVGPGQEDESSILSNSQGSPAYEYILHELGHEVE